MSDLIFSLNATLPVFFTMVLGMIFRRMNLLDDHSVGVLNKFVFKVGLPVLLFQDISGANFYEVWDAKFILFCLCATILSISLMIALSFLMKDRSRQGEFIQSSYRSSAALLGMAFIQNIYGNSGMAPLMVVASVPLYNAMAVTVLSVFRPQRGKADKRLVVKTLKEIVTNPIILGVAIGLVWSVLQIPQPPILQKSVKNIAVLATPLGLLAMGASFDPKKALQGIRPVLLAVFFKLIGLAVLFLPAAVALGFRESHLIAILVMLGSPATVTCFVMAKNMGHEGSFSSTAVMLTTLCSAFTLTGWLYVLKVLQLV